MRASRPLVIYFIFGVLAIISQRFAMAGSHEFVFSPRFEEFSPNGAVGNGYVWRDAGSTVILQVGSRVIITAPNGEAMSILFVGANQRIVPRGEQPAFKTLLSKTGQGCDGLS